LALDERRKAFRPTLWYIPKDLAQEGKPLPELKQVWFPGVHINIGKPLHIPHTIEIDLTRLSGGGSDDAIGDMKGDLERKWRLLTTNPIPPNILQICPQRHLYGCSNASPPT
jgi:hypothetical protein